MRFVLFSCIIFSLRVYSMGSLKTTQKDLIDETKLPNQITITKIIKLNKVEGGKKGSGYKGQVLEYQYEDKTTEENVMVKFSNLNDDTYFENERKNHKLLSSDETENLVPKYIESNMDDTGYRFIVMEKMDGTLQEFIDLKKEEKDYESIINGIVEIQQKMIYAKEKHGYHHQDAHLDNFLYKQEKDNVKFVISDLSGTDKVENYDETIAEVYFNTRFCYDCDKEFRENLNKLYEEKIKDDKALQDIFYSQENDLLSNHIEQELGNIRVPSTDETKTAKTERDKQIQKIVALIKERPDLKLNTNILKVLQIQSEGISINDKNLEDKLKSIKDTPDSQKPSFNSFFQKSFFPNSSAVKKEIQKKSKEDSDFQKSQEEGLNKDSPLNFHSKNDSHDLPEILKKQSATLQKNWYSRTQITKTKQSASKLPVNLPSMNNFMKQSKPLKEGKHNQRQITGTGQSKLRPFNSYSNISNSNQGTRKPPSKQEQALKVKEVISRLSAPRINSPIKQTSQGTRKPLPKREQALKVEEVTSRLSASRINSPIKQTSQGIRKSPPKRERDLKIKELVSRLSAPRINSPIKQTSQGIREPLPKKEYSRGQTQKTNQLKYRSSSNHPSISNFIERTLRTNQKRLKHLNKKKTNLEIETSRNDLNKGTSYQQPIR